MKIRKYFWILSLVGAIVILISIITPTSYNDTTSTFYYVWMTQIGVDIDTLHIYLLREYLELVAISTILTLIIFSSALMTITLTSIYVRNSMPFKKLQWKTIISAVLVITSTLYWIIMMELFYNESGYNHWVANGGGYSPFFGVIGPFIGAGLIVLGSFVRRE